MRRSAACIVRAVAWRATTSCSSPNGSRSTRPTPTDPTWSRSGFTRTGSGWSSSGNDRFTVTAGGVRPDWDLELLVSDRLAYVDGTWVPDGSPDYSETFATRSDPAGAASLELPLGLHGPLGRFYTTGPGWPYFDEGGLVAGPSSLFFQWVWKEVTIDRWTWEPTVHIRRSQLLEVVPR
ncbi:MAG: hypothetical protein JJ863_16555 [Deltaproteobacteria bacterium]|nr:hypothetical protein [Deltaproteobacteria bacterium]